MTDNANRTIWMMTSHPIETAPRRLVEVETTYLEMLSAEALKPARQTELVVVPSENPCPELNRFLYTAVGGPWYWIDRLPWTYQQWLDYLSAETLHTVVGYVRGTPIGYFEAEQQDGGDVEICSFGLLPQFHGQGYGGDLLTRAIVYAWSLDTQRVWLHTCSLDSPRGLQNYLARGFAVYHTDRRIVELPGEPPGPWPNSGYQQSMQR